MARAGDDQQVFRGTTVTLDGTGSFDPDEKPLSFAWTQLSGPTFTAVIFTEATLSFVAPTEGSYVFELTVTDKEKATAADIVAVDVRSVLGVTVLPADGSVGIAGRQPIVALFDAPVRPWTAAASLVVEDVTDPANPLPVLGNVVLEDDGTAVVFSPVVDWVDLSEYRVTVTTYVLGLDGAHLAAPAISSFFGAAIDTTAPTVVSVSPASGATDAELSTFVEILFSEPVDAAGILGALSLADGAPIDGDVFLGAGGTRAYFVPADTSAPPSNPQTLAAGTAHTVRVDQALQDEAGNGLDGDGNGGDFSSTFQTRTGTDTTAPSVVSISPLRGAQGVSVKLPLVATFSEPVEPSTLVGAIVLTSSGTAFGAGAPIGGTLSMSHGNTVAVFQPATNLATGVIYSVQVGTGITDLSGNPVPASFDSFFVTGDAPPPEVLVAVPDQGPIGSSLVVDVIGEDFVDGATVFLAGGGVLVNATTFLSETLLQADLTIAPSAAIGFRSLTVTNPDGQQATGLNVFEILNRPPTVSSLSPPAANLGDVAVPISVLGAELQNGATVSISGTDVTVDTVTFANAGQLNLTVSVGALASTGARNVTVTNPDGQLVVAPNAFTVREPAPIVTGMLPGSGGQGENLFSVVINGSEFQPAPLPIVDLGTGVLASTIAATTTTVTVNISIAGTAPLGLHDVKVTNGDGQSSTLVGGFSVVFAPPTIIGSSPPAPQAETTGVTFNGTNFQCTGPNGGPSATVFLAGTSSAGISVNNTLAGLSGCNATSFTRAVTVTSAAAVGLHDVRVRNPDNQFRDGANTFRVLEERPVVSQVQTSLGAPLTQASRKASYSNAKIIGNFFQNGATVSMGAGLPITSLTFISATELQVSFSVDAAATLGAVNVIVTNPDTLQGANAGVLSVRVAAPSIAALSISQANQGATLPGVLLTGNDFQCAPAVPSVTFSGAGVTAAVTACAPTQLTLTVTVTAAATVSARTITVLNNEGQSGVSPGTLLSVREQAPIISALTLSTGRQEQTVGTRINGSFFRAGAQVSFGAGIAVTIDTIDAGQTFIDVTLTIADAAAPGARTVTVTHPDDGQFATFSPFTVQLALPDVVSAAPSPRNQGEAFTLTVTGGDFDCTGNGPTIEVLFAGSPSVDVTENNAGVAGGCTATSFTRPVSIGPTAVVGPHSIRVTNPDSGQGTGATLQIREQAPLISSLSVPSGRQEQTVSTRINGSFLRPGAQVSFGAGIAVTIDLIDPGQAFIDVTLTIADGAATGARTVTVTHPDDGQNAAFSPFTVQLALPDVVSVSPTPGNQGASFTMTVTGDDFDCTGTGPTIEVRFGGVPSVDVTENNAGAAGACTATSFTRPVTIGPTAVVGAHSVRVTNPDSGQGTGGTLQIRQQAPVISGITVATGRQEQAIPTRINGSFFRGVAQVSFGPGVAVAIDAVDPGESFIDVTLTIADTAAPGARTVTVTHPDDGQNATFSPFTVQLALPDVISVSPTPRNQGDAFTLTVTGGDFDCTGNGPTIEVLFGGVPSVDVTENNAGVAGACTAASFTRPITIGTTAVIGTHTLRVTNPDGGQGTGAALQIRQQAPLISGLTVSTGRQEQTIGTRINGSFFRAGAQVSFGLGIAVSVDAIDPGENFIDVTLTIADGSPLGAHTVTVTHPDDTQNATFSPFTVQRALPDVITLAPSPRNQGDAFTLTVTGDDFDCTGNGPTIEVLFGGVASVDVTENNAGAAGACTATSFTRGLTIGPTAVVGAHTVRVTNPDSGQGTGGTLQIREQAPILTSLSVNTGRQEQTVTTRVNGSFLRVGAQVSFGTGIAVTIDAIDPGGTFIDVTLTIADAATPGARTVTVTHPDDGQNATFSPFTVQLALPDVVSVSPTPRNQGDAFTLTVTGGDFDCTGNGPTIEVLFGGVPSVDVTENNAGVAGACTATSFTRPVTIGPTAVVGVHTVRVTNPDSGQGTGAALQIRQQTPDIISLTVNTGRQEQTVLTRINGSFFRTGAQVSFGAGIAVTIDAIDPGESFIDVTLSIADAAALGARTVTVTHPDDGQNDTFSPFTVGRALPDVVSVSPTPRNQGQAFTLTVTGDDFDCTGNGPTIEVLFGGVASVDVTENNAGVAGACTATTFTRPITIGPTAVVGVHTVRVTNPDAGQGTGATLQIRQQAPIVSGLTVATGRQEQTVVTRINGSFFRSGAQVSFGAGIAVTVDAVDPGEAFIDVTLTIADAAATGARTVTVTHPDDGQNGTFSPFTVQLALPDVVSVSPSPRNQGDAFTLTVTGGDFDCTGNGPTIEVLFGGVPSVDVTENNAGAAGACTATSFTRTVSIGPTAAIGTHTVRVTNPDSGQGTGGTLQIREQAPIITSLSVNTGRQEQTVTTRVNGSFLRTGAQVSFGAGIAVTIDAIDPGGTFIDVTLTIADAAATGAHTVTVTHPDDGQNATFSPFTVQLALPDVTSVSPTPMNQGQAFTLTVNGDDFDCSGNGPTVEVLFGGSPSAGVTVNNTGAAGACSALSFTRPVSIGAGASVGSHAIRVTNPDLGQRTGATLQIRQQAPIVSSLSVSTGRQEQTVLTRINGSFFRAGAQVSFGAGIAVTIDAIDPGESFIDVTLGIADLAPTGAHTVTVTHPDDGQNATFSPFTVALALPDVVSVAPTPRNQGDAITLTVTGDDFICAGNGPTVEVLFGGVPSVGVTVNNTGAAGACSATSFTRPVSIGTTAAVGAHTIRVTNPDSGQGTGGTLQIREQKPIITGLTVVTGRQEQTVVTRINGSFFRPGVQVSLGLGIAVTIDAVGAGETFIDATLTIADAAATGARTVTVTHPDDGQNDTFSPFTVELALPDVVSVAPTPKNQGEAFSLTVTGGDFDCSGTGPTVEVLFGVVPSFDVTVNNAGAAGACSATSFTRPVSIGVGADVGAHTIRVTNPDLGQGTGATLQIREQAPIISGLTVATGRQEQTVTTRINGSFLRPGAQVSFGSGVAVTIDAIDAGESFIDVSLSIADAAPTGAHTVTVTHPDDGQLATFAPFTVQLALPDVVGAAPSPRNQGDSFTLTVTGGDFDCSGLGPTVEVLFGGTPDAAITVNNGVAAGACSALSFTRSVVVGAGASVGAHTLRVTNPDGGIGTGATLQIREQAPTITGVTVASGRQEQAVSTRINGTFFRPGAQVSLGAGIAVTVDAVDPGQAFIDVTLSIADAAPIGARSVTVTHPDDGQFATGATFTVLTAAPDVVSVLPSPVNQGDQNVPFTVSGDDFDCRGVAPTVVLGSGMTVDSVTCPGTGISENSLLVVADVGTTPQTLGAHAVTVTNPEVPQASGTLAGAFQVREQAPVITVLQTASGLAAVTQVSQKSAYANLRLIGDFFLPGVTVSMGSNVTVTAFTRITEQRIDVSFTVLATAPIGDLTITVNNPDGQSVSRSDIVDVRQPEPRITGVTPFEGNRGSVYSGASAIDVTGTDFDCAFPGPTVDFGADVAETVFSCTATLIEVNVDLTGSTLGPHSVSVLNPDGQSHSQTNFFEVLAEKPVVSAVVTTPVSGPPSNGRRSETLTVDVNGSFFQVTPTVSFGSGVAVTGVFQVNPSKLLVDITIAPGATLGLRNVTVNNPDLQSGVGSNLFEVRRGIPTITSIVRNDDATSIASQQEPAFVVTVTGDHFDCSTSPAPVPNVELGGGVAVGSEACVGTTNRETTLTASVTVGVGTVGLHSVVVTNAGDSASGTGANLFTVREEKPVLSSVAPSIRQGETLTLTLTGNFFQATPTAITTAAGAVSNIVWVNATTVTFTLAVPFAPILAGSYDISLTNPDGQSATGTGLVTVLDASPPSIASVCNPTSDCAPAWVDQAANDRVLTINGANFQSSLSVAFTPSADISDVSILSITPTSISLRIDVGGAATLGPRDVTVTNLVSTPNQGSGASGAAQLSITQIAPAVSSVAPPSGLQNSNLDGGDGPGGLHGVAITGTNFRGPVTVDFLLGGAPDGNLVVSNVSLFSATEVRLELNIGPGAVAGARTVRVTNADGSEGSLAAGFTVLPGAGSPFVSTVVKDPARGVAALRVDSANSLRQSPTGQLFHLLGGSFSTVVAPTVTISGAGVTAGTATVNAAGNRLDVTITAACGDIATGTRDIIITNAPPAAGNGLTGICVDCLVVRSGLVINEVASTERIDHGFGATNEVLELFNGSGCDVNITNWRLDMLEPGTGATNSGVYFFGDRTVDEDYTYIGAPVGHSRTTFRAGGFMLLDQPFLSADSGGGGDSLDNDFYFALYSNTGRFVDDLEVGDGDVENDGADGAPTIVDAQDTSNGAATNDGDNLAAAEEMVGRCPSGNDTDNDINDFFQEELGTGVNGMAATDNATNNPQCSAQCSNGIDDDGDGWIDMLDGGCTDPHTDNTEAGEAATDCNNGDVDSPADADGPTFPADEDDPDCFSGSDTSEVD